MALRNIARLVGIFAVLFNIISCSGSSSSSGGAECCTYTDGGYTYEVCADGSYNFDGYTGNNSYYEDNWDEVKEYMIAYYGADCS